MEELIEVKTDKNGIQTVSARELHEKLEVKARFNDWIQRMIEYGFQENIDYVAVTQKKVTAQGNESSYFEYFISIDMAKEICMIQRSEIGRKFRQYFINCEKALLEHKSLRDKSKRERNLFTENLKSRGYTKAYEYIQTTKQMKNALNITSKKEDMTDRELQLILASETLSNLTLQDEYGYHEVNPVCVDMSKSVMKLVAERKIKNIA